MSDDTPWGPGESEEGLEASPPRADRRLDAMTLWTQHEAARDGGRSIEATLALVRWTGRTGDVGPLRALLDPLLLDEEGAEARVRQFVGMAGHSLFQRYPGRARAALPPAAIAALLEGATPAPVLRQLAVVCDQYGMPCLAADAIDAALALAPDWIEPLFNRALIKMSLGDFFAARGDIKAMRDAGADEAEMLHQYLAHHAGEWGFVPAVERLVPVAEPPPAAVAPPDVTELGELWDSWAETLATVRARLMTLAEERGVVPSFAPPLPPDFHGRASSDDGEDPSGIPDLLADARRAWAALCAIGWATGDDEPRRPQRPVIAARAAALHAWASGCLARARRVAEGDGEGDEQEEDARHANDGDDAGVGSRTWMGMAVDSFHPAIAGIRLLPLFEELTCLCGQLAGVEDPDDDDDDDEDEDADADADEDEDAD